MQRLAKTDIKYLPGVGPKRAELLGKELDIHSFYDLLYYFPFRYIDRSTIHKISEMQGEMPYIQLKGHFISFAPQGEGAKRRLNALFTDGTGTIEVVWFNRVKYIMENYHTGKEYILFGKPTIYKSHYNMAHPEVDPYKPEALNRGLVGVYTLTEKMHNRNITTRVMQKIIKSLLEHQLFNSIQETLPQSIIDRYKLMPLREALFNIHTPQSITLLQQAQRRLKFEELFFLQMNILKYIKGRNAQVPGHIFSRVGDYFNNFYKSYLKFPLTGAQKRVIKEIRHDMGSGKQMNRLLQGDVGSGKTIVAFMTMLLAADNGYQACIMAPTEILATQHYESIGEMAQAVGLKAALLTGSTRKKERDRIHEQLMSGELNILIGTHALIEDTVQFKNLGLAIIDEQHRFGVAQRAKLWSKNDIPPHVLVMSATPIPRTLAMTVYGDLHVSIIDELPPGRKPVQTIHYNINRRAQVYAFLRKQIQEGRQVYVVYPLIKENEKLDLQDLQNGFNELCEAFPEYKISMVHGQMKAADKDLQMQRFASGETQILVATTVIEVGVNVPNATVMMIQNAERFGLSQLHQLRGRVGRGADQSYCLLLTDMEISGDTRKRMDIMVATNDGFRIAEEDLRLRGAGDIDGTQQSGIPFDLHIANLSTDGQLLTLARQAAMDILDHDPLLEDEMNRIYKRRLDSLRIESPQNWSEIS